MLKKFLKLGVLGLSAFLIFFTALQILELQYSYTSRYHIVNSLRNYDINYNYQLAWNHYKSEEYKKAENYYVKSLVSNPLYSKSLVDLAEINLEEANYSNVDSLLNTAFSLSPLSFKLLWRMSILSLWTGNDALSLKILTNISKINDNKVFDLAWRVYSDNELILNNFVNNKNIVTYMNFLINNNKIDESFVVWKEINERNIDTEDFSERYMDFLLRNNEINKALILWEASYGKIDDSKLVANGGFESKPVNSGFGWKIKKSDKAFIGYDWEEKVEGKYSLNVVFNGRENVNFQNISKIIPVDSESDYKFTSYIKTDDITTQNGVFWELACYPIYKLFLTNTEIFTGNHDWTKIEKNISVPESCNALKITLKRNLSNKLDKFISGKVWLDEVRLQKINTNE